MTLIELYQSRSTEGKKGDDARALLLQTHWFIFNSVPDPKTGDALPQPLSAFLTKIAYQEEDGTVHDRLWRITDHARLALERLFRGLNESPRREHTILPIHAVRDLDAASFIKLSNRAGRTIREKLAGKPYLYAPRRFQSVDLPENRLLKAFAIRVAELLELRCKYLNEKEDKLLPRIRSWLLSDEAGLIARWENLPPNNTLLSHRDYRRVWDAWRWLQKLDEDIAGDFSKLEVRGETMRIWNDYGRMYLEGEHLFAEMPVLFDFDKYDIRPWTGRLAVHDAAQKMPRAFDTEKISEPVCVDLAALHPRYAAADSADSLPDTYLWQQWKNDSLEPVDINLFNADAVYFHPDAVSISSTDLILSKRNEPEHIDRAARAFAARLRKCFMNDEIIWLVPDYLNDFELIITRRNLNACFSGAQPLPRSVAAVFEQVDYSRITGDGFPIVVVDTIGGVTCASKFIARFDQLLKERLPETNGFCWERCPTVIISSPAAEVMEGKQRYEMLTADDSGQWHDVAQPEQAKFISQDSLKHDPRIGSFAFLINVTESPVVGGIRLRSLQERASKDCPLWRDQIPELNIKVMRDGIYQSFYLVSRGTTVKPIRGLPVPIPINEKFTLPAGRPYYEFPLSQGKNSDELGFAARLDSPSFPLKQDAECRLTLTFEYGADEPYRLIFSPLDKSFAPVRATWERSVEEVVTDASWPEYPEPMSWADLRSVPKPGRQETSDLFDWFLSQTKYLDRKLFIRPRARTVGTLLTDWRVDQKAYYYSFAQCEETDSVFIHQKNFTESVDFLNFQKGDKVSFELQAPNDKYQKWLGRKIAAPDYKEETILRTLDDEAARKLSKDIHKNLYYPVITIWRDGRSLMDSQCSIQFSQDAKEKIDYLDALANLNEAPQSIKNEVQALLAFTHKDTTARCVEWLTSQVEDGKIYNPMAVGFALGDISQEWQQTIFNKLTSNPINSALQALAFAVWRERSLVEFFTAEQLNKTLDALSQCLNKAISRKNVWDITRALELILGLLRTRASADPDIKMLLQPHQSITKEFARQIDRAEEFIAESNAKLNSRIQFNIQKPDGVRIPDLLYALRLHLTGDNLANAIHITGISDEND